MSKRQAYSVGGQEDNKEIIKILLKILLII